MSVLNPNMRMVELVNGNLQPKGFTPNRRIRVIDYRRFGTGPARYSCSHKNAILDWQPVLIDDENRDFEIPRRSFTSSLKISLLNGQVKVVSGTNKPGPGLNMHQNKAYPAHAFFLHIWNF